MKYFQFPFVVAALFALAVGCTTENDDNQDGDNDSGTHTHADGSTHQDHDEDGGHSHDEGPHDGTVFDWGGGAYHVEFTVNHDKQEATVYILGSDGKSAEPIAAEEITLTIKDPTLNTSLKASPQEGDPAGKASRFVGNHEGLGVVQEYEGTVSGVVDGTPYTGNFKEVAHDH